MRVFVVVVLVCLVGFVVSQEAEASSALTQLLEWYDELEGQFVNVSWWHSGNALTSIVEYSHRTHNTSFSSLIDNMYWKNGIIYIYTEGYDDIQWWGLAWIAAYKLTQQNEYLSRAELIFAEVQAVWSTDCGGGIWWDRKKTYKNSITNELFLSMAAELYIVTNKSQYLTWAIEEWKWFNQSGLINSNFLINDGLNTQSCTNNGQTTWTYNQGVVLGGLAALYNITGDKNYLASAYQIAHAAMNLMSTSGILHEVCESSNNCDADQSQFKGVFMRNLAYLYQVTQEQDYIAYINVNAHSIWNSDRNGMALGLKWAGPFDTKDASRQSSALDALNAAMLSPS